VTNVDNIISAFTEEQVERLTGVPVSTLRYWDRTNFFTPSFADENRRAPFSRIYSFKDVLALRTINVLRNEHDIRLQYLRRAAKKLPHLAGDVWTGTTFYVLKGGKRVVIHEPGTDLPKEVVSGNYVLDLPLVKIITGAQRDLKKLPGREPDKVGQVSRSRFVNHNAWVVAGTRIPTAAIRRFKEAGYSVRQIIEEYPDLTSRDVEAALAHEEKLGKAA